MLGIRDCPAGDLLEVCKAMLEIRDCPAGDLLEVCKAMLEIRDCPAGDLLGSIKVQTTQQKSCPDAMRVALSITSGSCHV
jgi:hypothetical protein